MCARRAVRSDPAAKESRAMAQILHLLDFPPLNFQQLSVMEFSLSSAQNIQPEPDKFMPREGQLSDPPSWCASLECSWPALRPQTGGEARPETQADRGGERHTTDLPSWTRSLQKRSRRRQFQHQPGRYLCLRSVSERPIAALPTPCEGRSRATSARPCTPTSHKFRSRQEEERVRQIHPQRRQKNG